MAVVSKRGSR